MKVIAISGKAESGKDTVAKEIKRLLEEQNYKVMIIHFADVLKFVCRQYFDWNGEKDEYGRTLLQQVGTEMREKNNPNMWVNITKELINGIGVEFDYVLVPDTRFKEEINMLNEYFDCISVRVLRQDINSDGVASDHINHLTDEQRAHKSECDLDIHKFNYIIINSYYIDNEAANNTTLEMICNKFIKMIISIDLEDKHESV